MSGAGKAVFLSYASQDAEAAKRICDALRQAGVEVWFDQSELRGGDAWDGKIRKQIKECALFMPIISRNTQERREGYFRREWRMGVDRMADMDDNLTFLLPAIVDDTREAGLHVPDRFHERQWTRLPGGETPPEFAVRVKQLLTGEMPVQSSKEAIADLASSPSSQEAGGSVKPTGAKRPWLVPAIAGGIAAVVAVGIWQPWSKPETETVAASGKSARTVARSGSPTTPRTEAGSLVERAREITLGLSLTREQLEAAAALCERALKLDSSDANVWLEAARTDLLMIHPSGYDRSDERRKQAQARVARAVSLAPDSFDAQVVQAAVLAHAVGTPALLGEAEKSFRGMIAAHPDDRELVIRLAEVLRDQRRFAEAAALFEKIGEPEIAGWCLYQGGDARGALASVERSLRDGRSVAALQLNAIVQASALEDLDAAQAALDQILPSELIAETPAAVALNVALLRRDSARMLQVAQGLTQDFLDSNAFRGPRQYFTGLAHEIAGHSDAAATEWRAGLALVEERLKATPDDRELVLMAAWLQAALGEKRKADRLLARSQELAGVGREAVDASNSKVFLRLGRNDPVVAWLTSILKSKPPMWESVHAEARYAPAYDKLRVAKGVDKLLRESLPEGAKPIAELVGPEKPKSFWSRS